MSNLRIGDMIFELRNVYGISIEDFSILLGVEVTTIIAWEQNRVLPTEDEMRKISILFKNKSRPEMQYSQTPQDKSLLGTFIRLAGGENANPTTKIKGKTLLSNTFKINSWKGFFKTNSIENFDINNFKKPFMYSRVFLILSAIFLLSFITNVPLLINITGTIIAPLTIFMFVWEMNVFRNVAFSKSVFLIAIGGAMSVIASLIIYEFISVSDNMNLFAAICIALIEEFAKAITAYILIKRLKITKILPAIVIGASVGVGFAIIESIMYAYNANAKNGEQGMLLVILLRGVTALGGHSIWSSISAAMLVKVCRGKVVSLGAFQNENFLKVFAIPIILHTAWNFLGGILMYIILTFIGVTMLVALFNIGLREAELHSQRLSNNE